MSPLYQVLEQPGQHTQSFTISDAYVPASQGASIQNLSAFMMAGSDPGQYGQLRVYVTTPGHSVVGPALADSYIQQSSTVSQKISLLDQHGSQVVLGNILMVPIDQSMLYIRPLYTESTGNPQPQLKYVIAVFGQKVGMETSLDASLNKVLGTHLGTSTSSAATSGGQPTSSTTSVPPSAVAQAQQDLEQAALDFAKAQTDLKAGNLGTYQNDIAAEHAAETAAKSLLGSAGSTTTTTTTPSSSSKSSPKSSSSKSGATTTTTSAKSTGSGTAAGKTSGTSGAASNTTSTTGLSSKASTGTVSGTKGTSASGGSTTTSPASSTPSSTTTTTSTTTSANEA
jgi:hypothetical protein